MEKFCSPGGPPASVWPRPGRSGCRSRRRPTSLVSCLSWLALNQRRACPGELAGRGRAGSTAGLAAFLAGGGAGRLEDAPRDVRGGGGPPAVGDLGGVPGHAGGTAPWRGAAPADLTAGGSAGAGDPFPVPPPARAAGRARVPDVVLPDGVMLGHPAAPGLLAGNRSGGASLADAVPADAPHALPRAAVPP